MTQRDSTLTIESIHQEFVVRFTIITLVTSHFLLNFSSCLRMLAYARFMSHTGYHQIDKYPFSHEAIHPSVCLVVLACIGRT
jgi:hypothetical protein